MMTKLVDQFGNIHQIFYLPGLDREVYGMILPKKRRASFRGTNIYHDKLFKQIKELKLNKMENYLFEIKVSYPYTAYGTKYENRTEYVIAKSWDIAMSKVRAEFGAKIEAEVVCKESEILK